MNVYLDDVRPAPEGWLLVTTAEAVLALLENGRVINLSLDHDLNLELVADNRGVLTAKERAYFRDGTWLVNQMIRHNLWPQNKPWVHSANPAGAARMRALIDRYGPY